MKKKIVSAAGLKIANRIVSDFFGRYPDLVSCRKEFDATFRAIRKCFENNGTLFICGNGGSYADALHISSEFMKSFERKRPLPAPHRRVLEKTPLGAQLAGELEAGFRAIPLGMNGSLSSAIWNDRMGGDVQFAQELYVLGNPGDVLLGISTSGCSRNVLSAMTVARALGIKTIGLTGMGGGQVAAQADVALRLPGDKTCHAQESHEACYHALCLAIEAAFFPEPRGGGVTLAQDSADSDSAHSRK